jgi:ketosteroid isomerase-like protein
MPAKRPEDFHELFPKYIKEGNIESALTLYDPYAVFVDRSGEAKKGKDVIREDLSPFAENRQVFKFNVKKVIQNDDIALVHNQWEMVEPQKASGYAIEVFRRQPDGTWLLLIGDPFTIK